MLDEVFFFFGVGVVIGRLGVAPLVLVPPLDDDDDDDIDDDVNVCFVLLFAIPWR